MMGTTGFTLLPRRWALAVAFAALVPAAALADPPSSVGRLAHADGAVSFSPAGEDAWVRANVNRPLVTGDRLWADADGRVEIQFSGVTTRMAPMTSLVLANLTDRMTQLQLTQGTLQLRIRALASGAQIEIDTPNFAFVATRPGTYRFDVEPDGSATTVLVRSGAGDVYGDGNAYRIASGQSVRFFGTDLHDSEAYALAPPDAFERWAQSRDARYERGMSARYVAPDVVGYEDLDAYGTWRVAGDVGNVWFPREVPSGWAPYRDGHWAWIDPWGWTWVDDQPWGFAPFHYGRWTQVDERWCWVPGPVRQRAVYAPALVAFIGGANFTLSVSTGPAVGWFPLAPGEVYVPAYTVSRDYFTRVNVSNTVINTTIVTNVYANRDRADEQRFRYRERPAAITAVPASTFAQAQPVQRAVIPLTAQVINKAEVMPLAKIAPQRESVTGAAPAARGAPAAAMQKPVVAKAPPPPAPVPIEAKLPALRNTPGKPLDRPAADTARAAPVPGQPPSPAPTMPQSRVVNAGTPQPLPAKPLQSPGRGRDASSPTITPPGVPPQSASPPSRGAPGRSDAAPGVPPPAAPPATDSSGPSRPAPQAAPTREPARPAPEPAAPREAPRGPPARVAPAPPPSAAPSAPPPRTVPPQEQPAPRGAPPQEASRPGASPPREEARPRPTPPQEVARPPAPPPREEARPRPTPPQEVARPPAPPPQREEARPRPTPPQEVARPPAPPPREEARPRPTPPPPQEAPRAAAPPPRAEPPRAPAPPPPSKAPPAEAQKPPSAEAPKPPPPAQAEPPRGGGKEGEGKGKGRAKDNENN